MAILRPSSDDDTADTEGLFKVGAGAFYEEVNDQDDASYIYNINANSANPDQQTNTLIVGCGGSISNTVVGVQVGFRTKRVSGSSGQTILALTVLFADGWYGTTSLSNNGQDADWTDHLSNSFTTKSKQGYADRNIRASDFQNAQLRFELNTGYPGSNVIGVSEMWIDIDEGAPIAQYSHNKMRINHTPHKDRRHT